MNYLPLVAVLGVLSVSAVAATQHKIEQPVFLKSSAPANTLYHLDLMNASLDVRFTCTVLQGLVNREKPRLYISQDPGWHGPVNFQRYMDDMRERGHNFEQITPEDAIEKFRSSFKGVVIYDSGIEKDTYRNHMLNPLTLYCAVENVIPVTKELNEKLKLPVIFDIRGKYITTRDVYKWAYDEVWPKANKGILAHTHPTHMVLRDYLVQHKVMPIWLSNGMTAEDDDMAQRFLREAEPNSPLMGCWGGYGEEPAGRYKEPDLQRISSMHGKFIVVSDGCFNLSVFSGLDYNRPNMPKRTIPEFDPSKVYVVFHITDGDNIQWLQQEFISSKWWLDPNRGKVPISWSLNPLAAELIPNFVEYIQKTATDNDEFTCSTAGIGLVTPALYGSELIGVDRDALLDEYYRATDAAMKQVGETAIHLGDTSLVPWTRDDFDRCARCISSLDCIVGDYGKVIGVFASNANYTVSNEVVVLRARSGVGPAANDDERAQKIAEDLKHNLGPQRPGFVHVCLVNWYVNPTSILKAVELLGDEFVPVLPSEAAKLFLEAQKK